MKRHALLVVFCLSSVSAMLADGGNARAAEGNPATPIKNLVVVMQENHTFDNYFGTYPGADGIPPDTCMPVDPSDPTNTQCVKPFRIGNQPVFALDNSAGTSLDAYNNGKMNGFVAAPAEQNQDGSLSMGYYDGRDIPYYWNLADNYVLFDRFFSSTWGGSFWNHVYWFTGARGSTSRDVPLDGLQDIPTIFDRLQQAGISWKVYVRNYDPTTTYRTLEKGGARPAQVTWVPLLNMPRYLDTPSLFSNIVDLDQYFTDLQNNTLPAVSFIIPSGASEHPPGSIQSGQRWVKSLVDSLMRSQAWNNSAFLLTYDDWGGWYDHVPPPAVDEYGYGLRVPALLVSPYAKQGVINSDVLDFTSILKFIEDNYSLAPLTQRDAQATSIAGAFDFAQAPRAAEFISMERGSVTKRPEPRRVVLYTAYAAAPILAAGLILWASVGLSRTRRRRIAHGIKPPKDVDA